MSNINFCFGMYTIASDNAASSHFLGTKCLQLSSFLTNRYLSAIKVILTGSLTGLR
jgi:hypothetical protein